MQPEESLLAEWVAQARAGDSTAFAKIVETFERPLYRYLVRVTGDAALAQDLFQETFLKVHLGLPGYEPRGRLKAWVYSIATHLASDARRSAARRREDLDPAGLAAASVTRSDPADDPGGVAALAGAVGELPEEERAVVCLHAYGGLTFREIAHVLGAPLGTVLYWMHRATRRLRDALAHRRGEEGP